MAKKDDKPLIRFENLDGTSDGDEIDGEFVDPLDLEAGDHETVEPEDDPRANDPFAVKGDEEDPAPLIEEADPAADAAEDRAEQRKAKTPDESEHLRARLAEIERERAAERQALADARKELFESRSKRIDEDIAQAKIELKRAIEEGETDKQVELNDRLADLRANKIQLETTKEQPAPIEKPADLPRVVPQTEAAKTWMNGRGWINHPAYEKQNGDLLRVAENVFKDGFDPHQSDYYAEVERRMARLHPDLFASKAAPRAPGKQMVGRVSRDDPPRPRSNGNRVVLNAEDVKTMRRFGLDPRDKAHVREFAKAKVETARAFGGKA